MKKKLLFLALIIMLSGCLEQAPSLTHSEDTPTTPFESYKADWSKPEWTSILSSALDVHGQELLKVTPSDAKTFGFKKENAKQFYIMLISSMARYESAFDPATLYRECNKSKCVYSAGCQKHAAYGYCMKGGHKLDGGIVISRGLMQMSLQSAQGYGCSFLKTPQDLHNPSMNLNCAVIILNKWVVQDKKIGTDKKGGARYWSVLRESSSSRPKIIAKTKAL